MNVEHSYVKIDRINLNQDAGKNENTEQTEHQEMKNMANDPNQDNRSNQLNPNNDAYYQSRGYDDKKTMQTNTDSEIFDRYTTNQDAGKVRTRNKPETRR